MGLRVLLLKIEPEGTKKKKKIQTDSANSEVSYLKRIVTGQKIDRRYFYFSNATYTGRHLK